MERLEQEGTQSYRLRCRDAHSLYCNYRLRHLAQDKTGCAVSYYQPSTPPATDSLMPTRVYLAIDLGAESGRVMAGLWNGRTIRLDEIHRFSNGPVCLGDSLRWDVLRLWAEIQNGLAVAAKKHGKSIVSVGADTWGVDFVL